jgi:hypothetical protein
MDAQIKVVVQYSHRHSTISLDNKAGAKDLGGFVDAPDVNAKKSMSKPTTAPITIPPKPLRPSVRGSRKGVRAICMFTLGGYPGFLFQHAKIPKISY